MAAHQTRLTLKALQTQRYALQQQLATASLARPCDAAVVQDLDRQLADTLQAIVEVENASQELVVSEHALLRYFERILGYDLEALSRALTPPETVARIRQLGSGTYPVRVDGHLVRIRVQDRVVTTVLPVKGSEQGGSKKRG